MQFLQAHAAVGIEQIDCRQVAQLVALGVHNLATVEFEDYDNTSIGANVFAEAAIETILDEKYSGALSSLSFEYQEDVPGDIVRDAEMDLHELFMEKLSSLLD